MKRLNLGSGRDYIEGWVNLDIGKTDVYGKEIKADIYHDLNKYPYPFKNNEFDEILMIGILEHITDLKRCIRELVRISKNNAKITIQVPYFASYFAYRELYTHKFSLNCTQLFGLFEKNKMVLTSKRLENNNKIFRWIDSFINQNEFTQNFYERFLSFIFPVSAIVWKVRVKKGGEI